VKDNYEINENGVEYEYLQFMTNIQRKRYLCSFILTIKIEQLVNEFHLHLYE